VRCFLRQPARFAEEAGSDLAVGPVGRIRCSACESAGLTRSSAPRSPQQPATHDIIETEIDAAWGDRNSYSAAVRPVEFTAAVERRAGEPACAQTLRGADAIHLASALAFGEPDLIVAVWDRRLHMARKLPAAELRRRSSAKASGLTPPSVPAPHRRANGSADMRNRFAAQCLGRARITHVNQEARRLPRPPLTIGTDRDHLRSRPCRNRDQPAD